MRLLLIAGLGCIAAACSTPPASHQQACQSPTTHADYFGDHVFESEFHLEYLTTAHEPSLSCAPQTGETWRMLMWGWPEPVFIVSAHAEKFKYSLRIVEFPTATEKEPARVVSIRTRALSASEWQEITTAARMDDFWNIPVYDSTAPCEPESTRDVVCPHTVLLLMEGQADRYHVVSATLSSDPAELASTLRRLAGID